MSSDTASDAAEDRDIEAVRPLFLVDPGWAFVVGGLLLVVAGVLIPAQRELHDLREAVEVQRAVEDQSVRQLAAYDRFLNDLERGEPQLVKRLAASQLNLMPVGERPYMFAPTVHRTVTDWIEASEPLELPEPEAYPDTLLSRLSQGPRRLWVLACGVFLTFVGLLLGPTSEGVAAVGTIRRSPRGSGGVDRLSSGTVAPITPDETAVFLESDRLESVVPEAEVEDAELEDVELEDAEIEDAEVEDVELEDVELEDVEVEDVEVEDVEVEDVEVEDVEVEDAEVEDAEIEDVEVEDVEVEDVELEDVELEHVELEDGELEDGAATDGTMPSVTEVARESRAETVALVGEFEADLDSAGGARDACEPISAYDRALDTRSLFEGLAPDRWIETTDPRPRG